MKIEVVHKDGSSELSQSPLILQKGDIVIIDGKISDFDSFVIGTNNLIITINGESFIIQNTQLLGDNIMEYDNFDDLLNDNTGNHTALAFEEDKNNPSQDFIIDEESSLFDLVKTEAGEELQNHSTYFNPEFLERNGAEVQVEAKLNKRDFIIDEEDEEDKNLYGINNDTIYNSTIRLDPVFENGGEIIIENTDTGDINANTDIIETESEIIPQAQDEEIQEDIIEPITTEQTSETIESIPSNEENTGSTEIEEIVDTRETEIVTVSQDEEIQEEIIISSDEEILDDNYEYIDGNSDIIANNNTNNTDGTLSGENEEDDVEVIETPEDDEVTEVTEVKEVTGSNLDISEGDNLTFTLDDLIDNNNMDFTIVDISNINISVGTISENDSIYTIELPEDFTGTVELTYTITNGSMEISSKSLINVENINDIPEVTFINPEILEDSLTIIELNITDADNDNVIIEIFNTSENGNAIINEEGNIEYAPIKDFSGTDNITIKIDDGSEIIYKDIEITVEATNDEPIIEISESNLIINEDSEGIITFDISDIDGDNTSFSVKEPANGTIIVDGTTINYIPNENFSGIDSIIIDYTDGIVQKTSIININITEVNDNPVIEVTNEILMVEDTIIEIAMNISDIDSENITIAVDTDNGVAIIDEDGDIIYSPNPDFNGTDTIIITATDSDGGVTTKGITVQIDNDNTDTQFEIITSTIKGIETEIVEHIGLRDIQTIETRIIEVIDEEANTEAGITQNSDGEWTRTVQEIEVYNEIITEEKTREIEETFTNTRTEIEEFTDTREVTETFINTRVETEEFTNTRETIVEFEDTREVMVEAKPDQIIYETEEYVIDDNIYEETFTDTREITVEFEDTRVVQEEFTNTRLVQEEFIDTREVEVEFQDTRMVEETFINTRTETETYEVEHTRDTDIIDTEAMEEAGYNYSEKDTNFFDSIRDRFNKYSDNDKDDKDDKDSHHKDFSDFNPFNNSNLSKEWLDNDGNEANIIYVQETYTVTETREIEVPFEDTRMVEETFINTRTETEEFTNTRLVEEEFTDTREVSETFINTRTEIQEFQNTRTVDGEDIIGTRPTNIIDTEAMQEAGFILIGDTYTKITTEEFTNTRIETEEFIDTREVIVEFEDTRVVTEEFQNTREVIVEFEDTRVVTETYEEDVEYTRERLIEVEEIVTPITKEIQEEYEVTSQEEYAYTEEIQTEVQNEYNLLSLESSEDEIDLGSLLDNVNSFENIDEINIDDNKLSVNLDVILEMTQDESIKITGKDGAEIDLSTLPDSATVQFIGSTETEDCTYNNYMVSDSLGQELKMMIDNQIHVDL